MNDLLVNPWVIGFGVTIVGGVIVGLILYFVFGIGKEKRGKNISSANHDSPHIAAGRGVSAGRDIIIGATTNSSNKVDKSSQQPDQGQESDTQPKKQPNNLAKKPFDKPTPREIMDYLHNLPPLQREDAAGHYKGIKVSWVVSIESSEKMPNGIVSLTTQYETHISPAIFFEIELVKYPELKIINKDQEFKVEGEIDTVMLRGAIKLTNCKLYFKVDEISVG